MGSRQPVCAHRTSPDPSLVTAPEAARKAPLATPAPQPQSSVKEIIVPKDRCQSLREGLHLTLGATFCSFPMLLRTSGNPGLNPAPQSPASDLSGVQASGCTDRKGRKGEILSTLPLSHPPQTPSPEAPLPHLQGPHLPVCLSRLAISLCLVHLDASSVGARASTWTLSAPLHDLIRPQG